jgi:hypothetical protein
MRSLQIPSEQLPHFELLSKIATGVLDNSLSALGKSLRPLGTAPAITKQLVSAGIGQTDAKALGHVIDGMFSVFVWRDESSEEFVDQIRQSLLEDHKDSDWINDEAASKVARHLQRILDTRPLLTAYRGQYVSQQANNVYLKSIVFSDLRPVFDKADAKEPSAAVIVHNVNIAYQTADRIDQIFLTLTPLELDDLAGVIAAAQAESGALKKLLDKSGLAYAGDDNE